MRQRPVVAVQAFDTSIAIQRTNKSNLVVAWNESNASEYSGIARAITSTNGGASWSALVNVDPTIVYPLLVNDCRGVIADQYGNFLYCITIGNYAPSSGYYTSEIAFYANSTGGTGAWTSVYQTTVSSTYLGGGLFQFDFPQICLGTLSGKSSDYGLYFAADFGSYLALNTDVVPYLGFIPIFGLGQFGTASQITLTPLNLTNNVEHATLASRDDGTLYIMYAKCLDNVFDSNGNTASVSPHILLIKPPGTIDPSTVQGPWTVFQHVNDYYKPVNSWPYPGFPYFTLSIRSLVHDPKCHALYAIITNPPSWYEAVGCAKPTQDKKCESSQTIQKTDQDFAIFLVLSVDGGVTWSKKHAISTTDHNNRGFVDAMLDPKSGALYLGWYDARNSRQSTQLQYFGARVPAKLLKRWCEQHAAAGLAQQIV